MANDNVEIVDPDPGRIIEGLRDTGYLLETAIADIIDNSIAADATNVDLQISMDFEGAVEISIADDGNGMDRGELIEAMRYGSPKRSNPASLGKFGLGLKTASTAFCRQLSVISRKTIGGPVHKATWDLKVVADKGWLLLMDPPSQTEIERLNEIAGDGPGTLVLWQQIDRLLKNYDTPGGGFAKKALNKNIQTLKDHLSMVYQRFLDTNDDRAQTVRISVNNDYLQPWDPFCIEESEIVGNEPDYEVELPNGNKTSFSLKAYIIPRREDFSSPAAAQRARISNINQGIYVYRENRLIHGPDWMGMYAKEPHLTQLRVEFSFNHTLDDAFHIDIKKSQILLNSDLYEWLKDTFLPAPRRAADQAARVGMRIKAHEVGKNAHSGSNNAIHEKAEDLRTAQTDVINADKNEVEITNKHGRIRLKIPVDNAHRPGELHVKPVDSINDGLLWEPAIIDGNIAVSINTGHAYYQKVYLPNRQSGVTIQGLDSLIWALCSAELGTISDNTKRHFSELRFEVSRLLRSLVEDMPDPDLDNNA